MQMSLYFGDFFLSFKKFHDTTVIPGGLESLPPVTYKDLIYSLWRLRKDEFPQGDLSLSCVAC